jgi:hypothetical protein
VWVQVGEERAVHLELKASSVLLLCIGASLVIHPSCFIQFDVEPFYNIQAAEAAMSPAPAPGPGGGFVNGSDHLGPGSNGESTTQLFQSPLVPSLS